MSKDGLKHDFFSNFSAENVVTNHKEGCLGGIQFTNECLLLGYESGNIKVFSVNENFQLLSVVNVTNSILCLDYDFKKEILVVGSSEDIITVYQSMKNSTFLLPFYRVLIR